MLKGKFICAVLILDLAVFSANVFGFEDNGAGVSEREDAKNFANLGQDYCTFVNEQKNQCRLKMSPLQSCFRRRRRRLYLQVAAELSAMRLRAHASMRRSRCANVHPKAYVVNAGKNRRLPACQRVINFRARGGPEPTPGTGQK
ncbi:hypothetical protein Ddc_12998 [Ditylenchus destructor]|nr:hypothetical protein Ddc_12998 [Ditylenchus destructor]